jgi:hypothetical protein
VTRVLLAVALGLVSAAGGSIVAVPAPVGAAGLLAPRQQGQPELNSRGNHDGDLEDCQESQDPGLPEAFGASGGGPIRRAAPRRPRAPSFPNLLIAAPKTGPPTLRTVER